MFRAKSAYVLLGDPDSGKTTEFERECSAMGMLRRWSQHGISSRSMSTPARSGRARHFSLTASTKYAQLARVYLNLVSGLDMHASARDRISSLIGGDPNHVEL